ncbi:MAG: hypothetical protein IJ677_02345 [Alphaproteobacteria bacterium]|nr:hypothetical protein [Alphaproteobacteria bacterium]
MTESIDNKLKQLPFNFEPHNYMGREDFMVSNCNHQAFEMIDTWPNWVSCGMLIYGPKGCGKSHLAHLFVDKVKNSATPPPRVSIISAEQVNSRNVKRIADDNQCIVVEDLACRRNDEALFHLFNMFNQEEKYMLWTAEKPSNLLHFSLPDLQTRLNMLPSVAISEPDDMMLQMLIAKLFNDRQIIIGQDILTYIINNTPRSFAYVRDLIKEIDEISLAYQSSVNYNTVKQAVKHLAEKENKEPDLFEEY